MLLAVVCITIHSLAINEANANVALHNGIEDLTVNGDTVNLVLNIGIDEPSDQGTATDDNTGWEPVVIDEDVRENEESLGNYRGIKSFGVSWYIIPLLSTRFYHVIFYFDRFFEKLRVLDECVENEYIKRRIRFYVGHKKELDPKE